MAARDVIEAVQAGDVGRLRALVAANPADAAARDESGVSALMRALYRRRSDLAEILLAAGPPLDLFEAAALGRVVRLGELMEADPAGLEACSGDGFTALHFAAFFGHPEAAALLLERGADPSAVSRNPMRVAPLHSAVSGRHREVAALLLARGADPNARQQEGWTGLHGAAHNGDGESVELLLGHGADPALRHDGGKTATDIALEAGHGELARRLEPRG